jgi:hypothetical protein
LLIFRKGSNGRWRQIDTFLDLDQIEPGGFTSDEGIVSDPGCGKRNPCIGHRRYRWNGKTFVVVRTWYTTVQQHSRRVN